MLDNVLDRLPTKGKMAGIVVSPLNLVALLDSIKFSATMLTNCLVQKTSVETSTQLSEP